MRTFLQQISILVSIVFIFVYPVYSMDYYVDESIGTSGDGLSWIQAKKTIVEALTLSHPGDTVHVAEGHYMEAVIMNDSLTLLGGYPTGGGFRDFRQYKTIIDGSKATAKSVVSMDSECILDGFTIINGSGTSTMIFSRLGGGIFCSGGPVIIRNNIIEYNNVNAVEGAYGGAIYLYDSDSTIP